jgi:hypothetical protein
LWVILGTLAGSALFLGEALVDAWVEDQLYPIIKTLPKRAQDAWYELIEGVSGQPASRLESPPSKPTPERLVYHLPPAALTSATGLYASPNGAELIASATLPAGEIVYVIGRNSAGSHLRVVWIIGVGWVPVSFTDFNGRQEKLEPLPILSEPPPGATPITTCYSPNSEWTSRYKQRIAVIVDLIRSRYGEFPPSSLSLTVNGREVEISRRDIVNQGGQFLLMNTGFPLSDDVEPGDKVGFRFKSVSTEQPAFIAIIYRVQPRNLVELHDYSHIFWPIRSGYLFTALPPGLVHFVVKHLREVSGGQITETVSYEDEEALDNRNRTVPLQVPINMTRHYRHRINIRLNSSKVTEYWVRDAIVRLYALPLSDPEGTVREALSAISVVIPAGQRAKITFQWTELWAEGVISEGRDGTGNRLGSFSVFLGYVQPCSLVKQESIP